MKKIIAFGLMAIVSVFVFVSCSSSDNTPKGGYLKDVSYDVQAVRNSPDIEGELKTVKAIAVWKQPDAHGVSEHVHIVFSDETYAEFADNEQEISCIKLTNSYSNLIILRGTSKFFCAPPRSLQDT